MPVISTLTRQDRAPLCLLPGVGSCTSSPLTAIVAGDDSLSYADLMDRVRVLAATLIESGVGPGVYVGIALGRSIELIVAILAIVEAGGAYIPLDPTYPQERLNQMRQDANLGQILTLPIHADKFPQAPLIFVDAVASAEPGAIMARADGNDPLYAIFTSGSTGRPKAASVFRRGLANLVNWYVNELGLGPDDRTLVISSPSFDLTQKNFFAPLVSGGQLILDPCTTYDISRISALIRDHGVTLINCTPSAFYPLIEAAAADGYAALASLRFAVLGGEPISIPRIRPWLEHPNCRTEVVNSYGPTECTDICAFHRLHRVNLDDFGFVPLGREIPDVIVSIRDPESLAPIPEGETGELCIAGAGVGGGYLNDPLRTAQKFIDGCLYRTGDLAIRHPGGILEFRGRADHQVKVNGFRIEPGEIEIALNHHDAVRDAVVIAHDGRLIAFVRHRESLSAATLRDHLLQRVPAYMIPTEFHFVETFPLTPNGKVDRLALANHSTEEKAPLSTASDHEARILSLWSEVLGRPLHDPTANFFDLGGTSIHLAVVHSKLSQALQRELPITELFAHPSARALAAFLSPAAVPTSNLNPLNRARLQQAGLARFQRPTR
jgi:iturin family lipopeptide synthetase A